METEERNGDASLWCYWETITDESAAEGDTADGGWFSDGFRSSSEGLTREEWKTERAAHRIPLDRESDEPWREWVTRVADEVWEWVGAIDHVEAYGRQLVAYGADCVIDYRTGEHECRSIVVEGSARFVATLGAILARGFVSPRR